MMETSVEQALSTLYYPGPTCCPFANVTLDSNQCYAPGLSLKNCIDDNILSFVITFY